MSSILRDPAILTVAVLTLVASLGFWLFPGIDLAASRLFAGTGGGFPVSQMPVWMAVREFGFMCYRALIVWAVVSLIAAVATRWQRFLLPPRGALLVLLSSALAPGLVVNVILKSYWGRARPVNITEFGGDKSFSPAWEIADQCVRNCSFVSGEASSAMIMACLILITPPRWRSWAAIPLIAYIVVISGARIAFGGHFLSDVVISWGLTLTTILICRRMIDGNQGSNGRDLIRDQIDSWRQRKRTADH